MRGRLKLRAWGETCIEVGSFFGLFAALGMVFMVLVVKAGDGGGLHEPMFFGGFLWLLGWGALWFVCLTVGRVMIWRSETKR